MFAVLPTMLTLGNAVCGFGAITFAAKWTGYSEATSFFAAACLIYLAMVFDAFDGATARWANLTSEFGAQLDSLCDAVSFGAAPAFLMLEMARPIGYHPRVLWLAAALYVVCTLLRLARYNVESDDDHHEPGTFSGLPSPAAAAVVASFPIVLFGPQLMAGDDPLPQTSDVDLWAARALPFITFAVAWLMVSRLRYHHFFYRMLRGRKSGPYVIRLVFGAALVVAVPRIAIPLLACWYAFATPIAVLWQKSVWPLFAPRPSVPLPPASSHRLPRPSAHESGDPGA